MSALPPKADIAGAMRNVRFVPKADSCTGAKQSFGVSRRAGARTVGQSASLIVLGVICFGLASLTGVGDG